MTSGDSQHFLKRLSPSSSVDLSTSHVILGQAFPEWQVQLSQTSKNLRQLKRLPIVVPVCRNPEILVEARKGP